MSGKRKDGKTNYVLEPIWNYTANQIRELSFLYEKIGKILGENVEYSWELQDSEIEEIWGRLAIKVCAGCGQYHLCYRKGTLWEELKLVLKKTAEDGNGAERRMPDSFVERCVRKNEFDALLKQSYELLITRKIWQNKMLHQRKLLSAQMKNTGNFLFERARFVEHSQSGCDFPKQRFLSEAKKHGLCVSYFRICENICRKKEVFLLAHKKRGTFPAKKMAGIFSAVTGVDYIPAADCTAMICGEKVWLHFVEDVNYRVLSGVAMKKKDGENYGGDVYSILKMEWGKQFFILSDGMGHGMQAREESRRMVELLEQLLKNGNREEEAFSQTNHLLTFGVEKERYSSVDLVAIQLYSGVMKMIKMAGAPSFFVRRNCVEIIRSGSVPAGILWDAPFDVLYKKLYDGDRMILVSDGILNGAAGCFEEEFVDYLSGMGNRNPQQAAEDILAWSVDKHKGNIRDDLTVMVIAVWRKKK